MVEFGCRHINQEQNQYPNLDRGETMPGKDRYHVLQEAAGGVVLDEPETHESLEQASEEHDGPVNERLEQDRLDQRGPVVTAEEGHRVGDQHRLADDERSGGGEHKAAERDEDSRRGSNSS